MAAASRANAASRCASSCASLWYSRQADIARASREIGARTQAQARVNHVIHSWFVSEMYTGIFIITCCASLAAAAAVGSELIIHLICFDLVC